MSLKIFNVENSNDPLKEIVRLRASEKVNLKGYAIVDRTFDQDGSLSNEFRHIYVFPKLELKKGDWVRLYTGKGTYSTQQNASSSEETVHKLYWQSGECVWNNAGGDTATLIKFSAEDSKIVPAVSTKK